MSTGYIVHAEFVNTQITLIFFLSLEKAIEAFHRKFQAFLPT